MLSVSPSVSIVYHLRFVLVRRNVNVRGAPFCQSGKDGRIYRMFLFHREFGEASGTAGALSDLDWDSFNETFRRCLGGRSPLSILAVLLSS
jgi:hypothetical protein